MVKPFLNISAQQLSHNSAQKIFPVPAKTASSAKEKQSSFLCTNTKVLVNRAGRAKQEPATLPAKFQSSRLVALLFLAAAFLLYACTPPASSSGGGGGVTPPKDGFRDAEVFKSKNLYDTQSTDQTYTNQLFFNGKALASGVTYAITKPAGYAGPISIDTSTGALTFKNTPETITLQATHATKKFSYTFTVTDHFSPRELNGSLALVNNTLYLIGGNNSNSLADIWTSTDGSAWTKITTTSTAFTDRLRTLSSYRTVMANGTIYLTGGVRGTPPYLNDVWKSPDGGATWQKSATGTKFGARSSHTAVALGTKIYVIGGDAGGTDSDEVWESTDGDNWTEVNRGTPNADKFPARSGHSSVVISGGANAGIYVIGGFGASGRLNDVWRSLDGGVTWNRRTANAGFAARNVHSSVAVGQDIYVIGGRISRTSLVNDVWKSTDGGATWTQVALAAGTTKFGARSAHGSAVLGSTIYLFGGDSGGGNYFNDVWKSTDGATWTNVHAAP